ncbi:MAG: SprT-like domain-containing protein [Acidiferrobacterales bacterium]|nr:SprT-like domain-containing protein [Acidiferrobacterales bacterium]
MARHPFRVSDPVSYLAADNQPRKGYIASIRGSVAEIIAEDGSEHRKHIYALRLREGVRPKRVYTRNQLKKSQFRIDDEVEFTDRGTRRSGTMVRKNPKYARVRVGNRYWNVPYAQLESVGSSEINSERRKRLDTIATQADELIRHHELDEWRFNFDCASRRLGQCNYTDKTITMSEEFCLNASDSDIRDTILHEIAHALVGPEHGHSHIWHSKAKEIGCSAKRTHDQEFTPPKLIMSCQNCGWFTARQAHRNLVCKHCRTPVTYEYYSPERWKSLSASISRSLSGPDSCG